MTCRLAGLMLLPSLLRAQDTTAPKPDNSVAGIVVDAGTGSPLPDVSVAYNRGSRDEIAAKTDSQGHYELRGLPSGNLRISATAPFEGRPYGPTQSRQITLGGGQNLASIDFHLRTFSQISGRVLDENKEPMPGIGVLLIAREYSLGAVRYVYSQAAATNDLGEYTISRIEAGRAFLLMAQKRERRLPAIADTPANPKLRRNVPVSAFYPGSKDMQGAQPLTLRLGEKREAVDIHMSRAPSFCMEGVLEANGRPAAMSFNLADAAPTSGASGDGAMFMMSPGGNTADDGKFRICNLPPGSYMLTAALEPRGGEAPGAFGSTPVNISEEDVSGLKIAPRPQVSVPGELVFDGPPPEKPVEAKFNLSLAPMTRAPYGPEFRALSARVDIPGEFSLEGLLQDDYSIRPGGLPGSLYLKEITYGGHNILYEPFRAGSATGNAGIRITVGADGGFIGAKVADRDGNPVGDTPVYILPDHIASEAMLAAVFVSGQTDQTGTWKSKAMAPGKYYVLATTGPLNKSPEDIGKLWQARTHAQEVQVNAGGTASVTLPVRALD